MSSPDAAAVLAPQPSPAPSVEESGGEMLGRCRAMATDVTVRAQARRPGPDAVAQVHEALAVFGAVERTCTRFDPASPLMRLNARPGDWATVPRECYRALVAAHEAYERTRGRFDPRILTDLVALGYDRTLPFGHDDVATASGGHAGRAERKPWRPSFRGATSEVLLGGDPVDLGGIGKGLALRWAGEVLRAMAPDHLFEAGGDCWCAGNAPDGDPWRIGVEDPSGTSGPIAVLALRDRAVATSSVRIRRWKAAGRTVHHLIDPRTGQPGGKGLLAVTVVARDPAAAEVWSKVLFLAGRDGIEAQAARRSVAALWVTTAGELVTSRAVEPFMAWQRAA